MKNWRDMDVEALDDAYSNASYIPDAAAYPPRWQAAAEAFRAATPYETVAYGARSTERLDIFWPEDPPQGLIVFVHGGYWRRFGRSDWSHFAAGGVAAGYAVAIPGYPLVPSVRIRDITVAVSRAVEVAARRVAGPIRLTGHSAGGHLCVRLIMADAAPVCAERIATCVPISPMADLRPLLRQSLNADWCLDLAEAEAESPALGAPLAGPKAVVHVGVAERPSFLWQAKALGHA
ncbi:MAG: alpha/beta hydrolase [Pseudomonadota bacterium]